MEAYAKTYLYGAKKRLAHCFDYAINDQKVDGKYFYSVLTNSEYIKLFEVGNPSVIAGLSGIELAMNILSDEMNISNFKKQVYKNYRTKEYWLGYYLAEYQWQKGITFKEISDVISYNDLINMYKIYHEMDIEQFIIALDEKINLIKSESKLQKIRKSLGLSQSQLAKKAGVNIRSIQSYEQNVNAINKAEYVKLKCISKALGCYVEDIV